METIAVGLGFILSFVLGGLGLCLIRLAWLLLLADPQIYKEKRKKKLRGQELGDHDLDQIFIREGRR